MRYWVRADGFAVRPLPPVFLQSQTARSIGQVLVASSGTPSHTTDAPRRMRPSCWRNGMHDSEIKPGERVKDVHFMEDTMAVDLIDGRTIVVPLVWYPRLLDATPEQR